MIDDYCREQREQDSVDFVNNKIKRCRKCGNELHYMEKFHFSDHICCACKGLSGFEGADERTDSGLSMPGKSGHDSRTAVERELFRRYPQWQMRNEKEEKRWREEHSLLVEWPQSSCDEG